MPRDISPAATLRRIAAKEIAIFFASPTAYLFLASFAAVSLFVFFWGEAFFARNIADVRPLFEWMPVLLIFLASTLTMRLWSEERRSGTLEYVHAQPVPLWHFVVGKFLACLALLAVALVVTLPLPITVAVIGDLDWGPVWAGYLATFLLGAAYLSIGLFVSARSDNQIVSLISATALCGVFYLLGTGTITDFFGTRVGESLRLLGTGSRFESITRGVIDLRDLYYYLSLIAVFLVLNALVLERERWSPARSGARHRTSTWLVVLLIANALAGNLWLGQLKTLRADVTEGRQYSISEATENYLRQLREPLLIRGYFSSQTHPLLAPLVPRLEDLLKEYEVAGGDRVRLEIIDPADEPELEEEANRTFGISPVPFQVADRYQSSIVSSYFNVLVHYGDEYQVLGFDDLIEVRVGSGTELEVQLRNPEHDITRAIKKVLNSYQAGGNLFDTVAGELTFTAYVSPDERLPESLRTFRDAAATVVDELAQQSGGRLSVSFIDPDAGDGAVGRQIAEDFGFQPMTTSLFSDQSFFMYFTLSDGNLLVQVPLEDMSEEAFRRNLEAGIKRFASGFTKTVAVVRPTPDPMYARYGQANANFNGVDSFLGAELNLVEEDLTDGQVSGEADLLLLLAPDVTDDKQLFAIDQFLMQGGTVIVASSPFRARFLGNTLAVESYNSGLSDWLSHHGLSMDQTLVMDPQNAAFPLPVTRDLGGFQVQEVRMVDYPYFIDIRQDGLNNENAITADLPQLSMAWASPITVDETDTGTRRVTELLRSSEGAWLSETTDVMPRLGPGGLSAFAPAGEQGSHLLGVISAGRFDSFFAGRPSPLLPSGDEEASEGEGEDAQSPVTEEEVVSRVIEHSPESARIILFSSSDFLNDQVLAMAGVASGGEYLNSLQLLANTVDWSLEDEGLLGIRARGHFNRTLPPMEQGTQAFWEYLNYGLAALALVLIALLRQQHQRVKHRAYLEYV
jgi:ABC-2 type transport system permease protein